MWREAFGMGFAVVVVVVGGCSPCNGGYNADLPPAARVEVFDATTGAPVCDATVTLVAGSDQEVIGNGWSADAGIMPEAGTDCPYVGGGGLQTSTCSLTVAATGYQTGRKQVAIGELVCGVHETRNVTFRLQPQ